MEHINYVVLMCLTIIIMFYDLRTYKIPNNIIVTGLGLSLGIGLYQQSVAVILPWLFSVSTLILIPYVLFYFSAIGAGDVKFFSMIGGFLGIKHGLYVLGYSFLIGAIVSVFFLLKRKNFKIRMQYLAHYFHNIYLYKSNKNNGLPTVTHPHNFRKQWQYMDMKQKDLGACVHFSVPICLAVITDWVIRMYM